MLCQIRIAALPSATLTAYRTRLENQAKKWLDQGSTARDERLLLRVVEEAFVSRPTEKALELLGDLAFERGEFAVAAQWWTVLAPGALRAKSLMKEPPAPPPWKKGEKVEWRYPNPQPETVARVRAKQILVLIFRGENATDELAAFRELHPKAEGHLAGRTGNYAETLDKLVAQRIPRVATGEGWTTFAGNSSRNSALLLDGAEPRRLERLWRNDPTWRIRLDTRTPARPPKADRVLPGVEKARTLADHPVIAGQYVLYASATSVTALDILDGTTQMWDLATELKIKIPAAKPGVAPASDADPRYTLTVADGRVYARLGTPGIEPGKKLDEVASYLVCLDLPVPGQKMRLRWSRAAPPERDTPVFFEGAPVVRDGRVYIAASRFSANQMTTAVQCYPADAEGSPEPRWSVDVFSIRDVSSAPRYRHLLLTLAGHHVIACGCHAWAVVAIEAATGKPAWGCRYKSTEADSPSPARELSPPLYAEGRLYVAPSDSKSLLCLDPATGQLLWERPEEPVQLLGVAAGRLVFTTPTTLHALGAEFGTRRDGWMAAVVGNMTTWGRGFLAGDFVVWPHHMLRPDGGGTLEGGAYVRGSRAAGESAVATQPAATTTSAAREYGLCRWLPGRRRCGGTVGLRVAEAILESTRGIGPALAGLVGGALLPSRSGPSRRRPLSAGRRKKVSPRRWPSANRTKAVTACLCPSGSSPHGMRHFWTRPTPQRPEGISKRPRHLTCAAAKGFPRQQRLDVSDPAGLLAWSAAAKPESCAVAVFGRRSLPTRIAPRTVDRLARSSAERCGRRGGAN